VLAERCAKSSTFKKPVQYQNTMVSQFTCWKVWCSKPFSVGAGGIPVSAKDGQLIRGVEAVIDKIFASPKIGRN